jgi:4-diphosphocytidyl-2-C-methyl-D-erythritol kinase
MSAASTTSWEARACAKINLHLEVVGRRADGFHELVTVFQTIGLADRMVAEPHDGPFVLMCPGSDVPAGEGNLVWRAAAALAEVVGRRLDGHRLTLHKTIPTQAGLGGGSADAMAALRLFARLWGVAPERELLTRLGERLGSDVAFFADGGTALGTGRGEILTPLVDSPPLQVVLARPAFGVSTADAYGWLSDDARQRRASSSRRRPRWPATTGGWPAVLRDCWNDFEPVVTARHPVLAAAIAELASAGAMHALLSGSGSAVAGLFEDPHAAARAGVTLGQRPGWTCWVVPTLDRAGHARATEPRRVEV